MKLHTKDLGIKWLFFMLLTFSVVGCGPSQATSTPPGSVSLPTASASVAGTLAPSEILNKSIQVMSNLKSYHFSTQDTTNPEQAPRLEGDFEAPDIARFTSDMKGNGFVGMLVIGEDFYLKELNATAYKKMGSSVTIIGSIPGKALLDAATTITNTRILGDDKLEGVDVVHILSDYDATREGGLPDSVIGIGQVNLWIDRDNYYVHQQTMGTTKMPATSIHTYSKFNEPVVPPIERP